MTTCSHVPAGQFTEFYLRFFPATICVRRLPGGSVRGHGGHAAEAGAGRRGACAWWFIDVPIRAAAAQTPESRC